MKKNIQISISTVLVLVFCLSIFPCGPAFVTPVFDYKYAPENPYENFAAGKIGILKPSYHRSVLFAAYRYFNGGTFSAAERKALIEVWNADFNNKSYMDDDEVSQAVKTWVEMRKSVAGKEEKTPEIYVEREYGGYDFFPNCTKSAFETATETLKNRSTSYGLDDRDVKDWLAAQDKVFTNCSSGKQSPDEANPSMPEWLQKDRAYQMAAASFYSLDYADAKRRFAVIAQDFQSPWQETADYLVGRTLLRQASLSKDEDASNRFYTEAENYFYRLSTGGNKFSDSAERLLGLIKFRLHPEQRVRELAQSLSYQTGGENFRQELIDYTWLLDKFEKEALKTEQKRKETSKPVNANGSTSNGNTNSFLMPDNSETNSMVNTAVQQMNEGKIQIYFSTEDYQKSFTIYVEADATDEEALTGAELVAGFTLTDAMKQQVRDARKTGYSTRFSDQRTNEYPGRYDGEETTSLSILPEIIRADDLTDWLYTYQLENAEAYLYSLKRFKQTGSDLWLATAISKAEKSSTQLKLLFDAADKIPFSSPAFPTVVFNQSRLLIELNRPDEARKKLDDVLGSSLEIPVSSRNQFLELRLQLSQTLDEFLTFAQRKPFAFDFDGEGKNIEQIIAERKTWYEPEYDKVTKEEYDRQVEEQFGEERLWQDRQMFDNKTVEIFNEHFPLNILIEVSHSAALPEYLQKRFVITAFVRSLLLNDYATAQKLAPEVLRFQPKLQTDINQFLAAKPNEKQRAALFLILKNESFTPYVPGGLGSSQEQNTYASRWWCQPYEETSGEDSGLSVPQSAIKKPVFLTAAQSRAAQAELKRLKAIGDAPKYLGDKVLEWAKLFPRDRRIPESLFIVYQANDWDKYGCGGVQELRKSSGEILQTKYPNSEWTKQTVEQTEQ
ncbi:MAG: hypothetical protein ABIP06_14280 [Pyrinomonadaceae bacterium]